VRIKISATWEGVQAGRILERDHAVSVLITIVFGMVQAVTAAEAGVTCIAPYVGRIGDWFKVNGNAAEKEIDMGVERVSDMQNYLRNHGYATKVMAASFRSPEQALALAGVDNLTIAPSILTRLLQRKEHVEPKLTRESGQFMISLGEAIANILFTIASTSRLQKVSYVNDESAFRWAFNADACAVEKSADAMRKFAADTESLKALIRARLGEQ
jgi:transaldolase